MEGLTDPSYRYMCKQFGADLMFTEFVASDAIVKNIEQSMLKMRIVDLERPVGIQLYGHHIDAMVQSAIVAESFSPNLIDINFGCPAKKIASRGAGSGMLRTPEKLIEMTRQIVDAVKLPVTVKTRLGWDNDSIIIEELAEKLQDVGVQALTIHGRTGKQAYKGTANWQPIANVKNNPRIKIPIIGNGDITSAAKAKEYIDKYGTDAIMIGRATLGRPWIFNEIRHFLETGEALGTPSVAERVEIAKTHFRKSIEWKDEKGIYEIRRHFAKYFADVPAFVNFRLELLTETNPDNIAPLLDRILKAHTKSFL